MAKVVVVTGANRGLGFATVREMMKGQEFKESIVYLTSRDSSKGKEAVEKMQQELGQDLTSRLRSHQLDITNDASVTSFGDHLKQEHNGIDVLVHNAGMAFTNDSSAPFSEQARCTIDTNFYGTRRVARALHPLLRVGARVVLITSNCGHLSKINGHEPEASKLRQRFASEDLTDQELCSLMEDFVQAAKEGDHVAKGWPNSAYKVSKVGVSALARILQKEEDKENKVVVNHAHPGWLDTDMTRGAGHWPVTKGTTSVLWAATLPLDTKVRGEYIWEDATVTSWVNEEVNLFY